MNPLMLGRLVELLKEDMPFGDLTSELLVDEGIESTAEVRAKEEGVLSGIEAVSAACRQLGLRCECLRRSGDRFGSGEPICRLQGDARAILAVERTVLNLLGRLSGVATATWKVLERVRGVNRRVRVAGTRKTTPGLRELEKEAIRHGGGDTHRFSLSDMLLIKDNHIAIVGGVKQAVERAMRRKSFAHKVEVEVTTREDAIVAAQAGADIVMCDNMTPKQVREVVLLLEEEGLRSRVLIEVSGRIDLESAAEYARSGADILSMGALTHSVKAIDFSMKVI